jgi:hypothetical protein
MKSVSNVLEIAKKYENYLKQLGIHVFTLDSNESSSNLAKIVQR